MHKIAIRTIISTAIVLALGGTPALAAPPSPASWDLQQTFTPGTAWSTAGPWEALEASGATCQTAGAPLATPWSFGGGAWVGRGTNGNLNLPLVFKAAFASTLAAQGMVIAAGQVGLHPSANMCAVIRFKAPADGIYKVNGEFFAPVDSQTKHPNLVTGRILDKGVQVASGQVDMTAGNNHWSFPTGGTFALQAGDAIDFAVDNGGNGYSSDTVLIAARVTWIDNLPAAANELSAIDFDFEGRQACAVETGSLALLCWGQNSSKQLGATGNANSNIAIPAQRVQNYLTANSLGTTHALQVGSDNVCIRTTTGKTLCFGNNQQYQSGAPSGSSTAGQNGSHALVDMTTQLGPYQSFQMDTRTGCAIAASGDVRCWGNNFVNLPSFGGQLGSRNPIAPLFVSSATPMPAVPLVTGAKAVSTGAYSCAIVGSQNKVICWGDTPWGQQIKGAGQAAATLPGAQVHTQYVKTNATTDLVGISAIDVRGRQACANKSGTLYCWGLNGPDGAIVGAPYTGGGSVAPNVLYFATPMTGPFASGVTAFALSDQSVCAVRGAAATVHCQGRNTSGQLGKLPAGASQWRTFYPQFASATVTHDITAIPGLSGIQKIRGGYEGYCALDANHAIWCWGGGAMGQLGGGASPAYSAVPVRVIK